MLSRRFQFLVFLAVSGELFAENLNLVLLHNNDMHGRFEETSRNSATCKEKTGESNIDKKGCIGGFARTAHVIRKFRKLAEEGGSPVLFLNAGDTYVGTSWFSVHKWRICVDFLNALKPDVASLGNHEFDFGISELSPFLNNVNFPIVAANLNFDKEPSLISVKKSVILEVKGRKIGVIGHLTPDTKVISSPGNVEFLDVVTSVKKEAENLDKQGVKIIVVLGHSGYETDQEIAREVPLVDVVVGGHTNTFLWNGAAPDAEKPEDLYPKVVEQPSGKKVPVVQAYAYTKYLGILNVTFDDSGDLVDFVGQPILLDTKIPQEPDLLQLLEKYRPEVNDVNSKVVGKSRVLLEASANICRKKECNFGNMIADAFVFYMAAQYVGSTGWTDTPIGLINGGSIRTTIDPSIRGGNITKGELQGTLPFENQIISFQLTGEEIIKSLEIGARSNGETSKGEFLQVSGLHVVYNMNKPSFSRVVSVKVRCGKCQVPAYEPIKRDQVYGLVAPSFLTNGGDDHYVIKNSKNQKLQDLSDVDLMEWYLRQQSPVYPEVQGRIIFLDEKPITKSSATGVPRLGPLTMIVVVIHELFQFSEVR